MTEIKIVAVHTVSVHTGDNPSSDPNVFVNQGDGYRLHCSEFIADQLKDDIKGVSIG